MMKVVHKTNGGPPVEIARKNWEDQRDKKASEWEVVHEDSPVLLLKRKAGTDEFEEDQFYDLELTPMLLDRHPDDYKIMDYQSAKVKKPIVPINRKNLGEKYIRKFQPERIVKPKPTAPDPDEFMAKKIFHQPETSNRTQDEIDAEELDLNSVDASALHSMDDFEQIGAIKDNLGKVISYLMVLIFVIFAFIGGYYFRETSELPFSALDNIVTIAIIAGAFGIGFFLRDAVGKIMRK